MAKRYELADEQYEQLLKRFRRIATRFDCNDAHFLAFLHLPPPCSGSIECRFALVQQIKFTERSVSFGLANCWHPENDMVVQGQP